jgi:RHS repeat-associated protein
VFIEERNNTWNTPYLFNAKELDEEAGLYYYGARYYDPRVSIFYGVDPLVEETSTPYQYCFQNPVKFIDPTGMSAENPDDVISIDYERKEVNILHLEEQTGTDKVYRRENGKLTDLLQEIPNGTFDEQKYRDDGYRVLHAQPAGFMITDAGLSVLGGEMLFAKILAWGGKLYSSYKAAKIAKGTSNAFKTGGNTNAQLVQKAATKAEKAIGGSDRFAGSQKHEYATELLKRYQKMWGDRGLDFKVPFNNKVTGERGFLDVLDRKNGMIYDWKFGYPTKTPAQLNMTPQMLKYRNNFNLPSQIIKP